MACSFHFPATPSGRAARADLIEQAEALRLSLARSAPLEVLCKIVNDLTAGLARSLNLALAAGPPAVEGPDDEAFAIWLALHGGEVFISEGGEKSEPVGPPTSFQAGVPPSNPTKNFENPNEVKP